MHLITKRENKRKSVLQMQKRRPKRKRKDVLQIQKSMHKESLAVRAGSVRPRGLAGSIKKYVHKPGQNLLPDGADGRSAAYKTKRKAQKKAKKRHRRAKIYGLAAR